MATLHSTNAIKKNRPPDERRPIDLTSGKLPALVEKEPDTGAHQVLPQIATLPRVDLGTCIVEVVVFDKRAPLRIEEVISAGHHLPRQVCVICSASSVDGG